MVKGWDKSRQLERFIESSKESVEMCKDDPKAPNKIVNYQQGTGWTLVLFQDGTAEYGDLKDYVLSESFAANIAKHDKIDADFYKFMEKSNKIMKKPLCTFASENRPIYRSTFWKSRGLNNKEIADKLGYPEKNIDGYIKKYMKHIG